MDSLHEYTWQWAAGQNEDSLSSHLIKNQDLILQQLAADAIKIIPSATVMHSSFKILNHLRHYEIDPEQINTFISILKKQNILPENGTFEELLANALSCGNFPLATSLIKQIELPETYYIRIKEVLKNAILQKQELIICFIIENDLIKSSEDFVFLFKEACRKNLTILLASILKLKNKIFHPSQNLVESEMRLSCRQQKCEVLSQLLNRFPLIISRELELSHKSILLFVCTRIPQNYVIFNIVRNHLKERKKGVEFEFIELINRACKKAANYGNAEIVRLLAEDGAKINPTILDGLLYQHEGDTVLSLLEKHPQEDYLEILMTAIKVGSNSVIEKILIDFEDSLIANTIVPKNDFYTALLEIAYRDRNPLAARFCLDRIEGPLSEFLIDELLSVAIKIDCEELFCLLIEKNYLSSYSPNRLLAYSVKSGYLDGVALCIQASAEVNSKNATGISPLMIAALSGHIKIAGFLVAKGAKPNEMDKERNTPLHYAAYSGHDTLIEFLIRVGGVINSRNSQKMTPLHLACAYGWENCVRVLINSGASPVMQNHQGETPLHLAALCDVPSTSMIEMFVDPEANLLIQNNYGETAFNLLLERGLIKPLRHIFFPYIALSKLPISLSELDLHGIHHLNKIVSPLNIDFAISLEIPLLLNNYPMAHEICKLYSPEKLAYEIKRLERKYPHASLQMIKDSNIAFVLTHLQEGLIVDKIDTPDGLLAGIKIPEIIEKLLSLYDHINFADKNLLFYRDPSKLTNDGELTTMEMIREGLHQLFKRIEDLTEFIGTPKKDTPEFLPWYSDIEKNARALAEIIIEKDCEDEKASLLIELGIVGLHCGGRWVGSLSQIYRLEKRGLAELTLPDILKTTLQEFRLGIIEGMVVKGDVHAYNHLLYLVGEDLGLINLGSGESFKDPLADSSVNEDMILNCFYKLYNPTTVLKVLQLKLNQICRKEERRNQVIDWFKENIPLDLSLLDKEEKENKIHEYLLHNLYDDKGMFSIKRQALCGMLFKIDIFG